MEHTQAVLAVIGGYLSVCITCTPGGKITPGGVLLEQTGPYKSVYGTEVL